MHVVFIEDNASTQVVYRELCQLNGWQYTAIQQLTNIEATLRTLKNVDIVVSDLEMPHYNGYEIIQLIRQMPNLQQVPVVACTVYNTAIDDARNHGFNSFFVKPIHPDNFSQQLLRVIGGESFWEVYGS
jgi:CheY-like chemotaxis protein